MLDEVADGLLGRFRLANFQRLFQLGTVGREKSDDLFLLDVEHLHEQDSTDLAWTVGLVLLEQIEGLLLEVYQVLGLQLFSVLV